jgi:hypothetical protein
LIGVDAVNKLRKVREGLPFGPCLVQSNHLRDVGKLVLFDDRRSSNVFVLAQDAEQPAPRRERDVAVEFALFCRLAIGDDDHEQIVSPKPSLPIIQPDSKGAERFRVVRFVVHSHPLVVSKASARKRSLPGEEPVSVCEERGDRSSLAVARVVQLHPCIG